MTLMMPSVFPSLGVAGNCCCSLEAFPLGVLVAYMAWRRDPTLTPGQGFSVSFIACGLGTAVTALILIIESPTNRPEFVSEFREALQEVNQDTDPAAKLSPEMIEQFSQTAAAMAPYVPAVGALVCTLLAALSGLVTALALRGRHREPPSPDIPQGYSSS